MEILKAGRPGDRPDELALLNYVSGISADKCNLLSIVMARKLCSVDQFAADLKDLLAPPKLGQARYNKVSVLIS